MESKLVKKKKSGTGHFEKNVIHKTDHGLFEVNLRPKINLMKHTYIITCTLLFLSFVHRGISQESTFSAELPEVREEFVGATDDKMIYCNQLINPMNSVVTAEYITVNTKNPEEKKKTFKAKTEFNSNTPMSLKSVFVEGDHIYEIYLSTNYKMLGVAKRDMNTLKEVGEHLELNESSFRFVKADKDGFYLFSGTKLYRVGLDLKLIWSKEYTMFDEQNVRLSSIEVDDNQNVLMTVAIDEEVKVKFFGSTPPRKSSLLFIITDVEGNDPQVISPEIPESFSVKSARFNYDYETKQLKGLFLTTKESDKTASMKGIGYVFLKWNVEGEVINHEKYEYDFNDFLDADMKKSLELAGLKAEKCEFKSLTSQYFYSVNFQDNGEVFFAVAIGKYVGEFALSKLMIVLSPEGKPVWRKMLPYSSNELHRNAYYFISNGKVHVLGQEFVKSFESGAYEYNTINSPVSGKTVCMSERVFDLENGNELSNRAITNPTEKFIPTGVIYNRKGKMIVRYSYTIKNREQFLTITY